MAKHSPEIERYITKTKNEIESGPVFHRETVWVGYSMPEDDEERRLVEQRMEKEQERLDQWFDWGYLDDIEAVLQQVLEPYRAPSPESGYPSLNNAPKEIRDAVEAEKSIKLIKVYRDREDYALAVLMGIELGTALARAKVRPFEDDVKVGVERKKQVAGLNDKKHGAPDKCAADGAEIVQEVDEKGKKYLDEGCKHWKSRACEKLHEEGKFHGLSAAKIRSKYKYWKEKLEVPTERQLLHCDNPHNC